MADIRQLREIAKQLRELQKSSPSNMADVADWNAAARSFSETLQISLPSQVMHYLHDADIRIKDPEYRISQDRMITNIISDLESGIVPKFSGTTLSFRPHWLWFIALGILAIICWMIFR